MPTIADVVSMPDIMAPVFTPDGSFRPLAWFHSQHVERLFRAELLRMLLKRELINEAVVDNLLSWRHSGFWAHGAVRVEDLWFWFLRLGAWDTCA